MYRVVLMSLVLVCGAFADDESTPTFRSDVSMGRIDTLVLDRGQQPIRGLQKQDFVLRQDGAVVPIRQVSFEDLPVDVLLLLDVSGSMRVHVERVASAAHGAMAVLGGQDRVGIMVFDTHTRVKLGFRENLNEVERKLDDVVRSESFRGGTNINGALLDAAGYMEREGRKQARHAIVIVTDDQALPCDQAKVSAALDRADAVLMVLLAPAWDPYQGQMPSPVPSRNPRPPMTSPSPWPGGGGPLGPVILGRRRGPVSGPQSGPVYGRQTSAGSPEIARTSGGDSLNINDASAVDDTFARIRQRYAIYFTLPQGAEVGRVMQLDLADAARRRHADATLQYRQVTLAKDGVRPGLITRVSAHPPSAARDPEPAAADTETEASQSSGRRRAGVSDSSAAGPVIGVQPKTVERAPVEEPTGTINRRRGANDGDNTPGAVIIPRQ
jgi:VWFA-related protein